MNFVQNPDPSPRSPGHRSAPRARPTGALCSAQYEQASARAVRHLDFLAMRASYRASGGLARARDLALMLEEGRRSYLMSLEKLIASGTVFGFDWRGSFWVPMFQFELADLSLKPGPRLVSAELAPALDGWLKALWFVRPCGGLAARKPIEVMESNHAAVLDAARDCRMSAHAAAAGAQLSVPTG